MQQTIEHGMVVRRYGAGPPIVYVHGLGEAGVNWDALVREPALAGYTHVVPDLPGYGRSAWPDPPQSLDALADTLADWLGAACDGAAGASARSSGPVLVGHSMGGVLGVLVAERAPELLAALVNIDGNISLGDCVFSSVAAALTEAELGAGGYERLRERLFPDAMTSVALRGYVAAMRFADPLAYHRHSRDLVAIAGTETLAVRLATVAVPSWYIAGVPGGACERSRELLEAAGARWVAIEPAGHWVFVDQPAQCAAIIATAAAAASESR